MTDRIKLAEELEAAEGPSRDFDYRLDYARCGWTKIPDPPDEAGWAELERLEDIPPSYTSSIDDAMKLIPKGRILRHYLVSRYGRHHCEVAVDYAHGGWVGCSDHSFALALCAAALKAGE